MWLLAQGWTATNLSKVIGSRAYWIGQIAKRIAKRYNEQGPDGMHNRRRTTSYRPAPIVWVAWHIVEAMGGASSAALEECLEECLAAGLLQMEGGVVGYRHELARQAAENALAPTRRRTLHSQVLSALLEPGAPPVPLAQLVHHAVQAEDGRLVLRFAPEAAKQASAQGAHREAAAHLVMSLQYADSLEAEQQAALLDDLSHEYYLTGHIEEATRPCEAALTIWRALEHQEQVGHNLRRLSRLTWLLGRIAEAERLGMAAVEILETLPPAPGRELAMAYGNLSHLHMLQSDTAQTAFWGERAIELAERIQDTETVSYALNNVGSAQLDAGDDQGWAKLERSLQVAPEHGYEEHVARAYSNIVGNMVARHDFTRATDYLQRGLVYCTDHDLGAWGHCLRVQRAVTCLDRGDWIGAAEDATAILTTPWANGTNRIPALLVLGRVRARRGDPGAEAVLDEAHELAMATGVLERVVAICEARAEWRWLQGNRQQSVAEAERGLQRALQQTYPWYVGELAIWLWRGGGLSDVPDRTPKPFALQMAGEWRMAAAAWEQIGCPYEQALALMDGDEPAQRAALAIFERLGAAPAAELVRRQLRAAGVRGLPRGPRVATQEHPQGLTTRQLEILLLLAEGLHNTEIADRLSTTPKTAAHHVSAILAKLNARSRGEAVRLAHEMGILPQMSSPHSS